MGTTPSLGSALCSSSLQGRVKRRCFGLRTCATASPVERPEKNWFPTAGIQFPKGKLATINGVRGMIATDQVEAGELFASVPHPSALVLEPAKKCPFPDFCTAEYWKKSPWYARLGLMLLYEKHAKSGASRYVRYLEDLDAIKIETPLVWEPSELAELQYPWLEDQIQQQIRKWTSLYEGFKEGTGSDVRISKQEFFWALQAVRSRAFSGPYGGPPLKQRAKLAAALGFAGVWSLQIAHLPIEQVLNAGIAAVLFNIMYDLLMARQLKRFAMLPAIDYMNHSATIESDISYEIFRDRFTVATNSNFQKGEELKLSYGKHNNDYLLQFFGFCINNLAYDSYTIATEGRNTKHQIQLPKEITLVRKGLSTATKEWLKQCSDPKLAQKAIVEVCEAEKKQWLTSIQEDKKKVKYVTEDRVLLAISFRLQKKELLEGSIQALQK